MKTQLMAMFLGTAGVLGLGLAAQPGPAHAQAVQCGTTYTVVPGDSLSQIANRAYGNANSFQIIYSANAARIGPNPALIAVGVSLEIPCLETSASAQPTTTLARAEPTTEALPAPDLRKIRLVTGTDWAPFTNEDHPQGGLAVEIANVALKMADSKPDFQIDFINDWGAHLQPLISDHAYDFSLVWFQPNCEKIDLLSDSSKFRCNNLDWSEPIFEQIIGYFTLKDMPAPASHTDLYGKKVCRPAGYSTFMMEEHGLMPPNIDLDMPNLTTDCFEGLASGQYDVVVLSVDVAEGAILKLGMKDNVVLHENLSQVATMHAVIAKTHPRGDELLAVLDGGIRKMKDNGEWFKIVSRHLAEHRAKTR